MEMNDIGFKNVKGVNLIHLRDLLGGNNKIYEIPLFQRNYNWTDENCRELYDDIIASYHTGHNHFIGIFMYYNTTANSAKVSDILIDGQQRLTTIMLLLCAIRDVTDDEKLKKEIDEKYIYNTNKEIKFRFKLKQNNYDNYIFETVLENKIDSTQQKSRIYINYSKLVDWLKTEIDQSDLEKIYEYIQNMETVEIILKNDNIENVQQIFEKINSTGQPLTPADLIRNYLLFTGNMTEQQELYNKWTCIEKIVGPNNITKFVRAYTIRYSSENIVMKNIYNEFKKQFSSQKHSAILDDMIKYSLYYAVIEENKYYTVDSSYNIQEIENGDKYINNTLKMLEAIGTDDWIPLFMILFDKLADKKKQTLSDLLELILEFMIRYRVVQPSAGGGALQLRIYSMMRAIESKICPLTLKGIYGKLSANESEASRFPTDDQFVASLKENMLAKNGRILLYQYSRRRKREIMDFDSNITLEHLMPQTIDPDTVDGQWWISNLGKTKYSQIREKYTDCIGNYALLTRSLNSSISNGPWVNKRKEILERAFDEDTRKAANEKKWNEDIMKNRNEKFSSEIIKYITGPKAENGKSKNWLI